MDFLSRVLVCVLLLPMSVAHVVHSEIFDSATFDPLLTTPAPEVFLATTPTTESLWKLSREEAELVLQQHNEGRREVVPPAANMNILRWDDNLAITAQKVVDTCVYMTYRPSDLADRTYLAEVTGQQEEVGFLLETHIAELFELGLVNNYNDKRCTATDEHCEAYKIITWGGVFRIGCAQVHCPDLTDVLTGGVFVMSSNIIYWKCFYESDDEINLLGPSYNVGPSCSECLSGNGWCRDGLCDSTCLHYMHDCKCSLVCGGGLVIDAHDCVCRDPEAYEKYCLCRGFQSCASDAIRHPFTCICYCRNGFFFHSNFGCVDIDECATSNGGCHHYCTNLHGTYTCSCYQDYELDETTGQCAKIDECAYQNGGCAQTCINTDESYYCECNTGYMLSIDSHLCDSTTEPVPTSEGGHGGEHRVIIPCTHANITCDHICLDTTHGFMCECRVGFLLAEDNQTCDDINECYFNNGGCEQACNNFPGTFTCTCGSGLILDYDGTHCITDVCDSGSHCNGHGYFHLDECRCNCSDGYKGDMCETACFINETDCWQVFRERQLVYDRDYCPVFCRECACLSNLPACTNGGQLEYSEDFRHCRCYCPQPWAGKSCEDCSLVDCANDGVLNYNTCLCYCPDGWKGLRCQEPCVQTSMLCTSLSEPYCNSISVIADKCPILCGACRPTI